jgi:WD40 repeat protein
MIRTRELQGGCILLLLATCCLAAPLPPGRPRERAILEGHVSLRDLAFSPDGKTLASAGGGDGTARLWEVVSGKCTAVLRGHTPRFGETRPFVPAVAFSPDGKFVATAGDDGAVKLWEVATARCTATLTQRGLVAGVAFSPDGKTLATYNGAEIRLWDLQTEKSSAVYKVVCGNNHRLAFDPQGKLLFAGITPGWPPRYLTTLIIWDTSAGKPAFQHEARDRMKAPDSLAFSPDGKSLASAGRECPVQLWDVATGKTIKTYEDCPGDLGSLCFSPDGKILACGFAYLERGGTANPPWAAVRLYETATGKVLATLKKGKPGPSHPLAFSPDGRIIATGDRDGKIILWDLPAAYAEE